MGAPFQSVAGRAYALPATVSVTSAAGPPAPPNRSASSASLNPRGHGPHLGVPESRLAVRPWVADVSAEGHGYGEGKAVLGPHDGGGLSRGEAGLEHPARAGHGDAFDLAGLEWVLDAEPADGVHHGVRGQVAGVGLPA